MMDVRGYGHAIPEAYTTLESCVQQSVSHQRLIKYDFGGFNCIVRYEVDGYLEELSSGSSARPVVVPEHESISVRQGGKVVPQKAIFDIKTRSHNKKTEDILGGEIDRLWVRQIPNFIMAYHQYGVFHDIEVQDVREKVLQWETGHVNELRILSALVAEIVSYARRHPDRPFEICSQKPGTLEIRRLDDSYPRVLPEDLRTAWSGLTSDAASDSSGSGGHGSQVGSDAEGEVDVDSDDDEGDLDYTACTEGCGYCGRCKY